MVEQSGEFRCCGCNLRGSLCRNGRPGTSRLVFDSGGDPLSHLFCRGTEGKSAIKPWRQGDQPLGPVVIGSVECNRLSNPSSGYGCGDDVMGCPGFLPLWRRPTHG